VIRFLNSCWARRCYVAAALLAPIVGAGATRTVVAVQEIRPTRQADIVVLDGGFAAGLRQGMICRVTRSGLEVAEVVLVALRPTCSAALIMELSPRASIRVGDEVEIKVLKS
jgi:hypothetical protein